MTTTLIQPFQVLGAVYAGLLIGIAFSVLRLIVPKKNPNTITARIITCLTDAVFWLIATAIAAWGLFRFADGEIRPFMLLMMAVAAIICIKTAGNLLRSLLKPRRKA